MDEVTPARIPTVTGSATCSRIDSSLTDPRSADSDHDGVRDGAEDPDGDGLSDAGEYRYRTSPSAADSDGDGTSDWNEDSNGDGVPDGRTQDARSVPSGITPSLARPMDRPASYERCHVHDGRSRPIICQHGTSGPRVVLFGDSHALQWRSTLERIADSRGWHLYFVTKSACPAARIRLPDPECASWRQQAISAIGHLHPAMIITSEHDEYHVRGATSAADDDRLWRSGLTSTLRTLQGLAPRVVLLGDTPRWIDASQCLPHHRHDISACARRRSVATGRARLTDDHRAAVAAGVRYTSTFRLTCPYDPCPPVIDHLLVAYDTGHMTYHFARTLWRGLEALLPQP